MAKKKKAAKKAKKATKKATKKTTKKAKPAKKAAGKIKSTKKAKAVKKTKTAKATKKTAKPAKKITTKKSSAARPTNQNPFQPTPLIEDGEEGTVDFETMSETMDDDDTTIEEGIGEPVAERFEDDEIESDEDMETDDEEGYF